MFDYEDENGDENGDTPFFQVATEADLNLKKGSVPILIPKIIKKTYCFFCN